MGDHLKLHMPASIEKIAVPEKTKALFHAGHQQHGAASSHEAPAVSIVTLRTAAKQQHLPGSPRACLCSPTLHAGSFRCRLHRGIGIGIGIGGGGGGSVGSGLHEMSKKAGGV